MVFPLRLHSVSYHHKQSGAADVQLCHLFVASLYSDFNVLFYLCQAFEYSRSAACWEAGRGMEVGHRVGPGASLRVSWVCCVHHVSMNYSPVVSRVFLCQMIAQCFAQERQTWVHSTIV